MATGFMAASRMRTLRLFINNDLQAPINWVMLNPDHTTETGSSTFEELALFENITLEIYLSTVCCSIFKTSVTGVSNKRLSEELVLGLIEENLVDDIEEIKPIILRVEDDIVYVAVFNRAYFDTLLDTLDNLNRPIRFIQSFSYATLYKEESWTVFLSKQQRFIRTSTYEYYSLDDHQPLPLLLEDMLANNQPKSLLIYADNESGYNVRQIASNLNIEYEDVTNQYEYGIPVWNFYKQKSTSFKIKLGGNSKQSLMRLFKTLRLLFVVATLLWFIDIVTIKIDSYRLTNQIMNDIKGVATPAEINKTGLDMVAQKIAGMYHQRGLYSSRYDAIPLLRKFLDVVSVITPNDIKQIDFDHKELQIILGSHFDSGQFTSYKNILETKRVTVTIQDYKNYLKQKKAHSSENKNDLEDQQSMSLDDAAWVLTLTPTLMYNPHTGGIE